MTTRMLNRKMHFLHGVWIIVIRDLIAQFLWCVAVMCFQPKLAFDKRNQTNKSKKKNKRNYNESQSKHKLTHLR